MISEIKACEVCNQTNISIPDFRKHAIFHLLSQVEQAHIADAWPNFADEN